MENFKDDAVPVVAKSLTRMSNIYFLLFPHRGTKCYIFPQWHEVVQSCPTLCDPWTVVYQAPPSKEFSKQEYWRGLPFPSPEDLPNPGIEPRSPALQADILPSALFPHKHCFNVHVL